LATDLFESDRPRDAEMRFAARRHAAWAIATARTKADRLALWIQIPGPWRELVAHNVAHLLGAIIGAMQSDKARHAALEEVPEELHASVEEQVRRVLHVAARRDRHDA